MNYQVVNKGEIDIFTDRFVAEELQRRMFKVVLGAKRNCPVDTGLLRNSIYGRVIRHGFEIGARTNYAAYVELGTRPHLIRARAKKVLANKRTGEVFGKVVHHPGTKAQHFLQNAILNEFR